MPDGAGRYLPRASRAATADLQPRLARALVDDPPHLRRDGNFIRPGYSKELDDTRALRDHSRQVMAALEAGYQHETGIKALKVRHNNILGYYIEAPAGASKPMLSPPLSDSFRHRQTMAGASASLPRS